MKHSNTVTFIESSSSHPHDPLNLEQIVDDDNDAWMNLSS